MDTYWIFDFTVHYFSISSIFLFITYMAKNILIVTALLLQLSEKNFKYFYFISKPHFSNPFTTYMAFLSPNVTAILKFLKIFQLLFSIQTVVFPTITKKLLLQIHFALPPKS